MSLFTYTNVLMQEYITKTNEIYNSIATISNDVNTFNNSSILNDLNALKTSIDILNITVGSLTAPEQSDIDSLVLEIGTISSSVQTAANQINTLKVGYSIVETTINALAPSIKTWITQSSAIFGETVKLLEKAKEQGCR